MKKTVLVTGALGNVGREVVRASAARGDQVRRAVRSPQDASERPAAVEDCRFDFRDRETWGAALRGVSSVFLLRPPAIADTESTLHPFIDAAFEQGAEHVVFLSVLGAEKKDWVPHRKVERHLAQCRGSWTVLRPGFFAQNFGDAYLLDILEDDRVFVPAGSGRVAFVDVADVGDLVAELFHRPTEVQGEAIELTGPRAVNFEEAAQSLSQVLGRNIRYQPASIPGYAWHLRFRRGLPWIQVLVQAVLHRGLRKGEAEVVLDTVETFLGRPGTPLARYFQREVARWSV